MLRRPMPWLPLGLVAGLVLAILLALQAQRPPRPLGLEAPPTVFSAMRAMRHLDWIGAEPHPTGSPAHAKVRERLVEAYRAAGLEVQTQRASLPAGKQHARNPSMIWVENVMARLKGTEGGGAVMVATHYDSAPGSHGAADAGAGVASQLEMLRALQASGPLRHDVIFLVTDAEELGLCGAEAFASAHPWMADIKRVVNLEARGTSGPAWMYETSEGNADLIAALAQATPRPAASSLAGDISRMLPNGSDLMVFRPAGLRAMGVAFIDRVWDYHFPTDHPSRVDPASVQQMGDTTLGLVRHFAQGDLGPGQGRDAVYFNLPGLPLLHYPVALVPWLSLLGIALTLGLLVRTFRQKEMALAAWGRAIGCVLLGVLAAAGVGALLRAVVAGIHPVWGVREVLLHFSTGHYALHYNPYYLLVLVAAPFLVLWLAPRLIRSETTRSAMPMAILGVWGLLAPGVSWLLPGGSYLFQWPWLLALGAAFLRPRKCLPQLPALLALVLLFAPLVAVLGASLGLSWLLAAALPAWILLMVGLVWPVVESLREARLLLPISVGLALVGLVGGGLWSRVTFRGRDFANVVYSANLDTGKAWWLAERQHDGPWTRQFLDQPRAGEPSWEGDGRLQPGRTSTLLHQDAPLLAVPRPELELRSDTLERGLRRVRLAVHSAGAETLELLGGERLLGATVEGQPLGTRSMVRSGEQTWVTALERAKTWRLQLIAPPAQAPVEVVLTFSSGSEPLPIGLQARYTGLPPGLGAKAHPPAGILPIRHGNHTRVVRVMTLSPMPSNHTTHSPAPRPTD